MEVELHSDDFPLPCTNEEVPQYIHVERYSESCANAAKKRESCVHMRMRCSEVPQTDMDDVLSDIFDGPELRGFIAEFLQTCSTARTPAGRNATVRHDEVAATVQEAAAHLGERRHHVRGVELSDRDSAIVFGDFHGSAHSMMRCLIHLQAHRGAFESGWKLREGFHLLSCGDMVDRGAYGVEVVYAWCRLLLENPQQVHLNAGNHEQPGSDATFWERSGYLSDELRRHRELGGDLQLTAFTGLFDALACGTYLFFGAERFTVLCCHGAFPVQHPDETGHVLKELREKGDAAGVSSEMHAMMTWGDYEPAPDSTAPLESRRGHAQARTVPSGMVRASFDAHGIGAHVRGHQDQNGFMPLTSNPDSMRESWRHTVRGCESGTCESGTLYVQEVPSPNARHLITIPLLRRDAPVFDTPVFTTSTASSVRPGIRYDTYVTLDANPPLSQAAHQLVVSSDLKDARGLYRGRRLDASKFVRDTVRRLSIKRG